MSMLNPNNQSKYLCQKCQTYYANSIKSCPWCGTPQIIKKSLSPDDLQKKELYKLKTTIFSHLNTMGKQNLKMVLHYIEETF